MRLTWRYSKAAARSIDMSKTRILFLTQFGLLLAVEAIVCFTPLGSLPAIGPIVATLMMVPVMITGCLLGVGAGTAMGAFAGLFSFIVWTFTPPVPPMAFIFTPVHSFGELNGGFLSLLICFVPRALGGTVAGLVYRAIEGKGEARAAMLGGALGSLVNTLGVLGGIFVFFSEQYAQLVQGAVLVVLGGQVLTSGIPEALICGVVAAAVCGPVKKVTRRGN